jgi:hypothetical protein
MTLLLKSILQVAFSAEPRKEVESLAVIIPELGLDEKETI